MTEKSETTAPVGDVMPDNDEFKLQARVVRAIANEARLKIVWRLNQGECSVGELTTLVGLDASTVSKHLATLRTAGIVDDRREGAWVFYRLLTPCIIDLLSCTTNIVHGRPC